MRGWLLPGAAVAVWQLLASTGPLDYEYLPSPGELLAALVTLASSGELAADLTHTLGVTLTAAAVTLSLGAALGLAIGLVPALRRNLTAPIDFLRTIPAVTLVPVAVLTFGPTAVAELLLAVYAGLWPVVLSTAAGVAAVHPRHHDLARMLGLSTAATVRKIVMPATVPAWLVGARLAVVIGLLVAIVAEMLMYHRGLGGGLVESLNALAPDRMWAYALVCGLVGYLLNALLRRAIRPALGAGPALVRTLPPPRGLLVVVAVLVGWQLAAEPGSLSFPPPGEWLTALARLAGAGVLGPAVVQTLSTYALGLALATLVGTVLGAAVGASPRVDRALTPTIDFLAAVPAAALVPLAVLFFGPGRLSGVVAVALIVSWPVLLSAAAAARSMPAVRVEMSRTLGLSPVRRWQKVMLPSLAPGVMLGVRIASALALIVTLLTDIFGAGAGLGRLLVESQQRFDAAAAWGLLLTIGTFGYLTSSLLARWDGVASGTDPVTARSWSARR